MKMREFRKRDSKGYTFTGTFLARFVSSFCGMCLVAFLAAPIVGYATVDVVQQPGRVIANVVDSVVVTNAWARPALKGGTGGAYLTITNRSRRVIRVVSASCDCADSTELHVSSVQNGMAHMEMLPTLVVTSGASVSLKPGGMHFMLLRLRKALVKGDSTRLALRLSDGTELRVTVAVRVQ